MHKLAVLVSTTSVVLADSLLGILGFLLRLGYVHILAISRRVAFHDVVLFLAMSAVHLVMATASETSVPLAAVGISTAILLVVDHQLLLLMMQLLDEATLLLNHSHHAHLVWVLRTTALAASHHPRIAIDVHTWGSLLAVAVHAIHAIKAILGGEDVGDICWAAIHGPIKPVLVAARASGGVSVVCVYPFVAVPTHAVKH